MRRAEHNARLGAALGWLAGACYAPFEALREKHLMHHAERIDCVSFDYRPLLARCSPAPRACCDASPCSSMPTCRRSI